MGEPLVKDVKLPDYPSDLLQLALDDIAIINQYKGYEINTNKFHKASKTTCSVCLAGAVLANTLKFDRGTSIDFLVELKDKIGIDNCKKLGFIDRLRRLSLIYLYYDYKERLFCKGLTSKEFTLLTKAFKKMQKKAGDKPSKFYFKYIKDFKDFEKSHKFYSSIVEDIAELDKEILGRT